MVAGVAGVKHHGMTPKSHGAVQQPAPA